MAEIKSKEYYEKFSRDAKVGMKRVNRHIRKSKMWKKVATATEGKSYLGWLNQFANRRYTLHASMTNLLCVRNMNKIVNEIIDLTDGLKEKYGEEVFSIIEHNKKPVE